MLYVFPFVETIPISLKMIAQIITTITQIWLKMKTYSKKVIGTANLTFI